MIFQIVITILILSFLIIAHEAGHFFFAKRAGLKVEEFGLGYPPRFFSTKIGETVFSINLIPFGGFVKIYGEDLEESTLKDKNSFWNQPPRIKSKVILGGVLANLVIAVLIFYLVLGLNGFYFEQPVLFEFKFPFCEKNAYPMVQFVTKNSPAEKAGLKPGDIILKVDNQTFPNLKSFVDYINFHRGKKIIITIKEANTGQIKTINLVPRIVPPKNEGPIGIGLTLVKILDYKGFPSVIFSGVLHSINILTYSIFSFAKLISLSFTQKTIQPIAQSVAGVVGIFAITKLTLAQGIINTLTLIGLLSLAFAFANILPIPALDGGRMLFVMYEAITHKKPSPVLEKRVNTAGFVFLLGLLVLITFKDIKQFKDLLF